MNATFKRKLTGKDLLRGTIITIPSTEIIEIFMQSHLDWLFFDLEHGAIGINAAQHLLQVAGSEIPCLIRVPLNDEAWIKKALDIGPSGIIVPQLQTADEVKAAVRLCKYPPAGTRSVGIARAHGYGNNFQDYVSSANDKLSVIIQIEHINAVHNIDKIVQVPGIDCLFVGPYDLSASMGKMGQVNDPEVKEAISKVTKAAGRADISLGIFGTTAEAVDPYIQNGYTLIAMGIDAMIIGNAVKAIFGTSDRKNG